MSRTPALPPFQAGLFAATGSGIDRRFERLHRIQLDDTAWLDHAPEWVAGADALFDAVVRERQWGQRSRRMYDRRVPEPRLTSPWSLRSGEPLRPPLVDEMRLCLSERYGATFDSVGFNLYRDGEDSVAWHSDRIMKEVVDPVIALVSLGEPRKFLLRPTGGGPSRAFFLGRGDLLVTGGTAQRTYEHSVPKVAHAGPRISLAFRYGLDPLAYAHKRDEPL